MSDEAEELSAEQQRTSSSTRSARYTSLSFSFSLTVSSNHPSSRIYRIGYKVSLGSYRIQHKSDLTWESNVM